MDIVDILPVIEEESPFNEEVEPQQLDDSSENIDEHTDKCNDPDCPLLKLALQIYNVDTATYSLFVISLNPFRMVIARRHDGQFHPHLNLEFAQIKKSGIANLQEIFSEWYDIILDYYGVNLIPYYHNTTLSVYGFTDIITGNSSTYRYSYRRKYWKHHMWNIYTKTLLIDDPGRHFHMDQFIIYKCYEIANQYNYTTIQLDIPINKPILYSTHKPYYLFL